MTASRASSEATPRAVTAKRKVSVLGSTGSVGQSTLDLIERNPESFEVVALTANGNAEALAAQACKLDAKLAVVADEAAYGSLKAALSGSGIEAAAGRDALIAAAEVPADWIMAAIVGAAGMEPTLAAIRQGVAVGLANKETLVCAGALITQEIRTSGTTLLPVDSEHNAIFQVLDAERRDGVERLVLTASGGPFRSFSKAQMAAVTPAQALNHPNWDMGAKISIDSATMMNKGLELIEAVHLFDMPESRVDILVHPQSVIHSMVSYVDGSVLAQLGVPDMRTPIAYTLAWPDRMPAPVDRLDLAKIAELSFEAPDSERFPALRLAREALRIGGDAPTILNAANEIAVASFLKNAIGFLEIAEIVEETLTGLPNGRLTSLEDVVAADNAARRYALGLVEQAA
ncbi:1-deoxy-D-xylulose-5-phosphate reductoisomerase [Denitrobaculum tricleocarpae]|uniref:1-deoxy-D-xylulose 5-phosphate reductoisomerase n=1 Tax=Denitrobaculum tricleocarpae TaxID=2591009 RepID=A0A545TPI3_9PROT|nr:1-deoxy-D-xylulose-5-phosphate reductoisomerase [Denitrobaculum tricleocarpae]TQV79124.1 1-deoxy-D-xylulose-5-phosphate reductoisomerase [Denitrobaculum tricleocarpae]